MRRILVWPLRLASRASQAMGSSGGFTLVEVMLSVVIVAVSVLGLFQAFGYGMIFIEKSGYRRQALGLLQKEMEFWRWRFETAGQGNPITPEEARHRIRAENLDPVRGLEARVVPSVSPVRKNGDLVYQELDVSVEYTCADLSDTLGLKARFYAR